MTCVFLLMKERPCTRCEKKGIGDQCVEGVRKKAKYLLEEEERGEFTQLDCVGSISEWYQ